MQYRTLGRTSLDVAPAVVAPGVGLAPEENVTPLAMGDESLRRR